MKAEIILAIVWTSFCICDRQQRSTVLTDEYKRVLEHFDFSNFDKQEALNYIDRQRYENQIRGKRSHSKFKRDHGKAGKTSDLNVSENHLLKKIKMNKSFNTNSDFQVYEKINDLKQKYASEASPEICTPRETPNVSLVRTKRGHRGKKKHRSKYTQNDLEEGEDDEEDEGKYRRHRKERKKKKRKRRYWDNWTEWSPCSVTCGRGRKIRWRKCIVKNCTTGELEMGEKTCQLPACNLLTKLLGL